MGRKTLVKSVLEHALIKGVVPTEIVDSMDIYKSGQPTIERLARNRGFRYEHYLGTIRLIRFDPIIVEGEEDLMLVEHTFYF